MSNDPKAELERLARELTALSETVERLAKAGDFEGAYNHVKQATNIMVESHRMERYRDLAVMQLQAKHIRDLDQRIRDLEQRLADIDRLNAARKGKV
jgi:DNA repair exonuclease SbcCD ATPase subunit